MENVKKQVKRLTCTTKSLEEKAKNIDRCNREGDYDTDRPWEELILGLLELRKQVDALLALHGWKEIDMTKPQPCTKFAGVTVEERVAKLNEETYGVMRDAAHIELIADEADDEDKSSLATCLAIDLTDVIHVCVSWIAALGFNEEARGDLHRMVNEKNRERGYF